MRIASFSAAVVLLAAVPAVSFAQEAQQTQTMTAAPSADVNTFAQAAHQSSLAEVLMSAMALQKTNDKRVEEYAWTMLDHHARALGDLAEALSPGAAPLPTTPSPEQSAMLDQMRGMESAEFDQAYFAHQAQAHQAAIAVFEQGASVSDARVAQYAATTLPILRAHREIVEIRQAQPPQPLPAQ